MFHLIFFFQFINNINHLYERLLFRFHILWGFAEFLTNVKPIVISDFYSIINLYTIKPTVVKSGDVKTIR